MIPYDEEFLIFTLPTTAKGSARVTPGNGVKIHHVYYWCEAFRIRKSRGGKLLSGTTRLMLGLLTPLCTSSGFHVTPSTMPF